MRCGQRYCGAGRAPGYDVAKFAVRADCGPIYCGAGRGGLRAMMWQHLGYGLTAGQLTAGRGWAQRGGLRAQMSSPRSVFRFDHITSENEKRIRF